MTDSAPASDVILVVDDEPNLLDMLVDTLSLEGYQVDGAASGKEALAAVDKREYHAALLDYSLGDTTGLALTREIHQRHPDLNVILMTAHATLDMAVKAIQADVYDYLIKPVDTGHLKRSLTKVLEKRRMALEIKNLVGTLKTTNQELARVNDLKSKFLSIVTHDLRTPLASIRGYAQLLAFQKGLAPDQATHFLDIIMKESDHLGGLISDLMDFVSIEAGKLRIEKTPTALSEIIETVSTRMKTLADQKKITLETVMAGAPLPPILLDKRRIDQVVTNLVGNALKHTPVDGKVTLRVELRGGKIHVDVTDTGEGIPPEAIPRLFTQFFQVESHASKKDGIGLGLTIAKEIIAAHGGDIGVHSDGQGTGSRFWFTLPIP